MDKWISIKDGRHQHIMLNMKKMVSIYLGREILDGKEKCCIYFEMPATEDTILPYKSHRKRNKAMKAIQDFINVENTLFLELVSDRK